MGTFWGGTYYQTALSVVSTSFAGGTREAFAHILVFMSVGGLICRLGHRLHVSERRLKVLAGLLPICAACKQIREKTGEWRQLESYIKEHSEADFTHGLCPTCVAKYFTDAASRV